MERYLYIIGFLSSSNNVRTNFGEQRPLKIWDREERPKFGVI